ncbi:hypothetical protein PHYBOEH_001832 [Phytophthora boehmeriae]|uniref:Alpha-1,3-mannosyltransferase n=1 Tax=Phytophthora boehmeriae TaxID=109152 RepID=A0A8T1WTG5_9STRA|nr:hypothetical protein PHYBOEH_001832 [Phytophthora boehmeriae]
MVEKLSVSALETTPSLWLEFGLPCMRSKPARRRWCWLPRILLVASLVYASLVLFWSVYSIDALTSRSDSSKVDANGVSSAVSQGQMAVKDYPRGQTKSRNLRCIGWRATRRCSPDGRRDTEQDRNCTQTVSNEESGYCEVEDVDSGERFRVMRRHCNSIRHNVPFRCESAPDFANFRVEMHHVAEKALDPRFMLPNVVQTEQAPRDGIVMVVYPKLLASAYATIKVLREVLGCRLPIEIWYRPDELKRSDERLTHLRHLADKDKFIMFQEIDDPLAKRFVAKIHAIYYSSFDRVLFLDADNTPVRDPSFLFESPEFVKTGAVFWPDFWFPDSTIFGVHENSLLWELLDMPFVDMFEQESGQLIVDRGRHAAPLELVRSYALHSPNFFSDLKLVWGDKDLFRLAWLKLNVPFHMIQTPPGMAGVVVDTFLRSDFCGMTMVQHDANGDVLFLHRNQHKLTGKHREKQEDENERTAVQHASSEYEDPAIWTHLFRFRKESRTRDYLIQSFRVKLDFDENQKCFGRRDIYRNPHFSVQEIANFYFSGLESHLRQFALESHVDISGT